MKTFICGLIFLFIGQVGFAASAVIHNWDPRSPLSMTELFEATVDVVQEDLFLNDGFEVCTASSVYHLSLHSLTEREEAWRIRVDSDARGPLTQCGIEARFECLSIFELRKGSGLFVHVHTMCEPANQY